MKRFHVLKRLSGLAILATVAASFVAMGCDSAGAGGNGDSDYTVSGRVMTEDIVARAIGNVEIAFSNGSSSVTTDSDGNWSKSGLSGRVTVTPEHGSWTFDPAELLG